MDALKKGGLEIVFVEKDSHFLVSYKRNINPSFKFICGNYKQDIVEFDMGMNSHTMF